MNRLPLLLGLTLLLSACHMVPSVRKADAPQGYAAQAAAFTRVAQSAQTPADCPKNLPGTYTDLTCRQTADGFCAFFANGKPFFCQEGPVSYRTNTWGSALTVTRRAQDKQLLSERYYADGQLARAQELDPQTAACWTNFISARASLSSAILRATIWAKRTAPGAWTHETACSWTACTFTPCRNNPNLSAELL